MNEAVIVEGYAALFGAPDLEGDVVRAGAFRASLSRKSRIPMLLHHEPRLLAGEWTHLCEESRGLFVRGRIEPSAPGARRARALLNEGADGLSIGFVTRIAERTGARRLLIEVELLEVSIVAQPMQPQARLTWRAEAPELSRVA